MGATVALVACAKTKRKGRHRARDLYCSALFSLSAEYAELHADRWFILSAKFGLLDPDELVTDYEETLKNKGRAEREAWGHRVKAQLRAIGLDDPQVTLLWLAGRDYMLPLAGLSCRQVDPLAGLRLGERLAWLSANR